MNNRHVSGIDLSTLSEYKILILILQGCATILPILYIMKLNTKQLSNIVKQEMMSPHW